MRISSIKKKFLGNRTRWEGDLVGDGYYSVEYKDGVLSFEVNDEEVFSADVESKSGDSNRLTSEEMMNILGLTR